MMQQEHKEDLPKSSKKEFEIPKTFRVGINIVASTLSFFIISIYFYLIFKNPKYLDPDKFGLPTLLVYALTVLLFINLPWKKLGLRPKSPYFEVVELEEKVEGQAKNVYQDIAGLQVKLDEIERKSGIAVATNKAELEQLLIKFLEQYKGWAFSPRRIKEWGAAQTGYSSFTGYSLDDIKAELRRLLAKSIIRTTISKKGNTLYRYNK